MFHIQNRFIDSSSQIFKAIKIHNKSFDSHFFSFALSIRYCVNIQINKLAHNVYLSINSDNFTMLHIASFAPFLIATPFSCVNVSNPNLPMIRPNPELPTPPNGSCGPGKRSIVRKIVQSILTCCVHHDVVDCHSATPRLLDETIGDLRESLSLTILLLQTILKKLFYYCLFYYC